MFCETLNISIVHSSHNSNYRCRNLFFNVTYQTNVITILYICYTVNIYLLYFYYRNVSISVNECYKKPLRAAKLKDSISEALLLFLYIYRELSEVSSVVRYVMSHLYIILFSVYVAFCSNIYPRLNKQDLSFSGT